MPAIHRVTTLDLTLDGFRWPFAEHRRAEIDEYFATLRATKPQLWNGRVLLARDPAFTGATFSARYFETDFASIIAWRDWGFPDGAVFNAFGMGALRGSDGAFVLGEMAAHTANAGRVYFPSGTPDPGDVRGSIVDIAGSVARELTEETGLQPSDYTTDGVWHCVASGASVAMIRILDVPSPAATLRAKIMRAISAQTAPEFSAIHVVRGIDDFTAAMPDFVTAFLRSQFVRAT